MMGTYALTCRSRLRAFFRLVVIITMHPLKLRDWRKTIACGDGCGVSSPEKSSVSLMLGSFSPCYTSTSYGLRGARNKKSPKLAAERIGQGDLRYRINRRIFYFLLDTARESHLPVLVSVVSVVFRPASLPTDEGFLADAYSTLPRAYPSRQIIEKWSYVFPLSSTTEPLNSATVQQ